MSSLPSGFKHLCSQRFVYVYENYVLMRNGDLDIDDRVLKDFWEYGFIKIRGLLDSEELSRLRNDVEGRETTIRSQQVSRDDGEGKKINLVLWYHPRNDVTGMIARCEKVVESVEQLLGGEVYHYHSKLILKDPFTGGAFVWHQDYGYWYNNGCLYPDMATVWIAIDRADKTNGCLKIIPKSHKLGRVDHIAIGDQTGADPERVKFAEDLLGIVQPEMDPGDALIFHCNLLHRSDQNSSPNRRWAFLSCFNRASNIPVYEHCHHAHYTPLVKVPNKAIKEGVVSDE